MSKQQQTNEAQKSHKPVQQAVTPAAQGLELAPLQEPLDLLLQRAELEPHSVSPADATRLQRTVGNQAVGQLGNHAASADNGATAVSHTPAASLQSILTRATVQPKLTVGPVDDPYEREADQVAQQVVQRLYTTTPPPDDKNGQSNTAVSLQRQQTDEEEPVQMQPQDIVQAQAGIVAPDGGSVTPDIEANIQSARGGGQPLADTVRAPMENAFGTDFGSVRVHTGGQADTLNQSLSARAFTTGSDIFFRQGEYNPGSHTGQELLAHELTHVVQQGASQPQQPVQRQEDEELLQGKRIQRQEEGAAEDDTPTPAEKAAALAAAAAAQARASTAKSKGESDKTKSKEQAKSEKVQAEAPKKEVAQSLATGKVSDAKQKTVEQTQKTQKETRKAKKDADAAAVQQTQQQVTAAAQQGHGAAGPGANGSGPMAAPGLDGASAGTGAGLEGATAAAQAAVQQAFDQAQNPPDKAPDAPEQDPGYQTATRGAQSVGKTEQQHAEAQGEADEAQLAAESPASEIEGKAQAGQVGDMEAAETPEFDAAAFKSALMERIAALTPKSVEEADEFKEGDKAGAIKNQIQGTVTQEQETSQQPLDTAREAAPDTGSVEPKPTEPLTTTDAGAPPSDIGAETAVPKPRGEGEVEAPLQTGGQSIDQQMADADISEEQLTNANEPEFSTALEAKEGAQQSAKEAPGTYRQEETAVIGSAEQEAVATAQSTMQGMHSDRSNLLTQADDQQVQTKSADEQKRAEVAAHINTIYAETQTEVEGILANLDTEVMSIFDAGAAEAEEAFESYVDARMEAYKEERYGGFWGWAKWAKDKLLGMPSEVNAFYAEGRDLYIGKMDAVIDNIAALISTTLTEAKAAVAKGKQRIQEYVDSLPQELQSVGQEAAQAIQSKFDELEQQINDKQTQLIDTLAQKYQQNLQAIDARIEEMKAANKGLVDKAIDAIGGVIKTIIELKNMLLNVLARIADAVMKIIKDPIGFLGNLLGAIKQGFGQFVDNIGTHLKKGLISWLTGSIAEAGITLPETFDLKGIFQLVLQILGISFEQIMGKVSKVLGFDVMGLYDQIMQLVQIYQEEGLVGLAKYGLTQIIGQEGVDALMEVVKIFDVIKNGDFGQLWEIIQGHLSTLKDMVMGKIEEFIAERVIKAGITWLISLFNPAGAFIKACKMIYDVVMFFIENGSKIMSLVNAIIDSVAAIASGNISAAANFIEQSLAKFIPVAISFLSSLLGLGNISGKVKEIIESVRNAVDSAIDKVLNSKPVQMVAGFIKKAIDKVKNFVAAGIDKTKGLLGLGGEEQTTTPGADASTASLDDNEVGERQLFEARGDDPTLMMASTPKPINEFLDFYVNEYSITPSSDKGKKVAEIRGFLRSDIDPAIKRLKQAKKTGNTATEQAIQAELLQKNTTLSQKLRELLSGDRNVGRKL
ncbi:MAG: DUF4157 domain-containing protein [Chloroflexota bacterium]